MEIDAENLIYCIFDKKPLWDKTTKLYRNKLVVEKLWREVATELGGDVTLDAAKKKWKSLRDTFGKELRKVPEGRFGDAGPLNFESHTSWPYFESMQFLRHQMKPRKSGGNLSVSYGGNNEDGNKEDYIQVEYLQIGEHNSAAGVLEASGASEYANHYNISEPNLHHLSKRPTKQTAQQQLLEIEERKLKLLESKASWKSSPNDDDDEDAAFFKSLLPHARKLKPVDKIAFRMDVQGLVQKYVYKKSLEIPCQVHHTPLLDNHNMSSNTTITGITPLHQYQSTPSHAYSETI